MGLIGSKKVLSQFLFIYAVTITCTMMKPYFKGKTANTKPMHSRSLIHLRVAISQLYSKVQCLWWPNIWFVASQYESVILWFSQPRTQPFPWAGYEAGFFKVYGLYPAHALGIPLYHTHTPQKTIILLQLLHVVGYVSISYYNT